MRTNLLRKHDFERGKCRRLYSLPDLQRRTAPGIFVLKSAKKPRTLWLDQILRPWNWPGCTGTRRPHSVALNVKLPLCKHCSITTVLWEVHVACNSDLIPYVLDRVARTWDQHVFLVIGFAVPSISRDTALTNPQMRNQTMIHDGGRDPHN